MPLVFFSYAEEDHLIVAELADLLAQRDVPTWYYGRDSIFGVPYTDQIAEAFAKADLVVLLASPHSVSSHQVKREAEQAHHRNLPILPVLHGISSAEVRERQPGLSQIFGTRVYGNTSHSNAEILADRIVEALTKLVPARPSPRVPTHTWASDSKDIEISELDEILFPTDDIKSFLNSDHQFFVSANKGLGKTLLLRSKRARLTNEYRPGQVVDGRPAVHLIPEGRPYLDMMGSDLPTLSKNHLNLISSLSGSKRLWSFAIRLSAISHFPDIAEGIDQELVEQLVGRASGILVKPRIPPSVVYRALLALPVRSLNQLLDKFEHQLSYLFHSLHSGAVFFIDRVDLAIAHLPQQAWIHIQAGLIEAAWDVMNSNNHVKVYATIREEAFANYESDCKPNLHSSTLTLRYTVHQLKGILDRLTKFYEGVPDFSSFIRMPQVGNTHCRVVEESFRYLHRHTVGRPRDMVIICHDLSKQRGALTEQVYRNVVNESAAHNVVKNIFSENRVFLDALSDEKERHRFFSLLPHNILMRQEVEAICAQFNGLADVGSKILDELGRSLSHPFCELYCCGLIGIVPDSRGQKTVAQRFKQPHDVMRIGSTCLPHAAYYVLHPSLQTLIDEHRTGVYQPFRYVVVGHDYPWMQYHSALVAAQRTLWSLPDAELTEDVLDTLGSVCATLGSRGTPNLEPLFQRLERLERRDFVEAYLAVEAFCSEVQKFTQS